MFSRDETIDRRGAFVLSRSEIPSKFNTPTLVLI